MSKEYTTKKRWLNILTTVGINLVVIGCVIGVAIWNTHMNASREKTEVTQAMYDCQQKAPYFQWEGSGCKRVSYESKAACIADGRESSRPIDAPREYYVTCQDDGTWKSGIADTNPAKELSATCKDVTSYDYNWDNDMLCTRTDGSRFYTSYEDAKNFNK